MILWLDLETYSDIPIANGVYKYAEKCEILLFSWAINDDPVFVVDVASGEQLPDALRAALFNPAVTLCAHNSNFDRCSRGVRCKAYRCSCTVNRCKICNS